MRTGSDSLRQGVTQVRVPATATDHKSAPHNSSPRPSPHEKGPRLIRVDSLTFSYRQRHLFQNLTLTVKAGESMAISGSTGSGKSTLLALLTGMARITKGEVNVAGTDIRRASSRQLSTLRLSSVGVVHQQGELIPTLNAIENVMLPMLLQRRRSWHDANMRAYELCEQFDIRSLSTPAETLSGGERQRVALARALANSPTVLLADEPTASLDPTNRDRVADYIYQLTDTGRAVLVVTHDAQVAHRAHAQFELSNMALKLVKRAA